MAETAPVDLYVRRALGNSKAKTFAHNSQVSPPTLVKGRTNSILWFPGSFNPPHQGHKDTLVHAFFRGGDDLNIIAAIVILGHDSSVGSKYEGRIDGAPYIVLPRKQRAKLFDQSMSPGGFHWCYTRDNRRSKHFAAALVQETANDGFDIRFVGVAGPDWLGKANFRDDTIIVGTGDPSRMQYRAQTMCGFEQVPNYSPWSTMKLEEGLIQQLGSEGTLEWLEQKFNLLFPGQPLPLPIDDAARLQAMKDRIRTGVWRLGETRVCHYVNGSSNKWIRFVPTRFISTCLGGDGIRYEHNKADPSSTAIWKAFNEAPNKDGFVETVQGTALCPEKFWEYARKAQRKADKEKDMRRRRLMVESRPTVDAPTVKEDSPAVPDTTS